MPEKLDHKLECPACGTIYLRIPDKVKNHTLIQCSSCARVLGRWSDLLEDFDAQGGQNGIFGVGSGWGRNDTLSFCLYGPKIFAGQQDVRPAQRRDVG